ncbi:hypothetical protein ABZ912_36060 [Nonomuraea angiospora]|uniref:hypothetical protein n=1 Tax=Nonomuraea angiospora TaxID=46172 RepID=UPI0033C7C07C
MRQWQTYIPNGSLLCVVEASCCEEYILCNEGGEHFIRRQAADGIYEETARGPYMRAATVWVRLSAGHVHQREAAS